VVLLDTGDALVGGGMLGDLTQGEAIVAGMNLMHYDAMALGPLELSLGLDVLRQRMQQAEFPMLSANVVVSGTEALVAQPYTVLDIGSHRLGVLGLTRLPAEPGNQFRVLDPQDAAARYLPELESQADVVVVVTNLPYTSGLALASALPGIHLLIAALPDQLPEQAVRAPETGTLVVTAEQSLPLHSGRRVSRLAVTAGEDGTLSGETWVSVAMGPEISDDPQMAQLLDKYRH
jgi:2',3'-cyclic-nucleotide 2'-phosphodiesterase (5'-nucleotidase family)